MIMREKFDPTLGELAMGENGMYVPTGVEIHYPGMNMRMECESQEEVDQVKDMLQSMFDIHQRNVAKNSLKPQPDMNISSSAKPREAVNSVYTTNTTGPIIGASNA